MKQSNTDGDRTGSEPSPIANTIAEIDEYLENEQYDELRAKLPVILAEHEKAVAQNFVRQVGDDDE